MHTHAYICQLICTVVISGSFLTQEYKLQVSETDAVRKYLDQKVKWSQLLGYGVLGCDVVQFMMIHHT